jgi:hypothetical protein
MALYKTGLANSTKGTSPSTQQPGVQGQLNALKGQVVAARVLDIILDENHPKFNEVGQWNGIGAIYYEFVNQSATGNTTNFALPYDSQIKTYPLVNEIVLLFSLPNQQMGFNTANSSYFYLKPLGIWNHPHHDAYPNLIKKVNPAQAQDYKSNGNGTVRQVTDGSTEIELNSPVNPSQNTFVEKTDIHPLMPYMGDVLMEGRHGQSLRFGSTAKSQSAIKNDWSTSGNNGDPITILRNGQPTKVDDKGWIPIVENINQDLSSIYLTSTQKLTTFSLAREESIKWKTYPTSPSQYALPQTIITSDRILINAKNDSVLIGAQQSIGLSCYDEINLTGNNTILDSTNIYLGSKNATESVLLGDKTITTLRQITSLLKSITSVLQLDQMYPGGIPVPNGPLNTVSLTSNQIFAQIESSLDNLASKKVKVE